MVTEEYTVTFRIKITQDGKGDIGLKHDVKMPFQILAMTCAAFINYVAKRSVKPYEDATKYLVLDSLKFKDIRLEREG